MGVFFCIYICTPKEGIQQLWATMWVLRIELRTLEEQPVLLTAEPSLQVQLEFSKCSFIIPYLQKAYPKHTISEAIRLNFGVFHPWD